MLFFILIYLYKLKGNKPVKITFKMFADLQYCQEKKFVFMFKQKDYYASNVF